MKKDHFKYILFLIIFYLTLFTWKHNFFGRYLSSEVKGKVIDISEDSPVEMVPVGDGRSSTFTNYKGEFAMNSSGRGIPHFTISTPGNYETGNENLKCKTVRSSLLDQAFFCETSLYPQPFEAASRVLNDERAVGFNNFKEREIRKKSLWYRSSRLSREAFGTEGDFIFLISRKEEIEIKKETQLVKFNVSAERKILGEYFDPIMGKSLSEVAEVEVVRYFADGSVSKAREHFVREDGIWRYLIPFTHKSVYDFVVNNEWILKVKK